MNTYLISILFLLLADWLRHITTEWLNLKAATPEAPADLTDIYDPDRYALSQRYLRDNTRFDLMQSTFSLTVLLVFILGGGIVWIHTVARQSSQNTILQGLLFTGILILLGKLISIPFAIYDTFVIEQKYGFNRTQHEQPHPAPIQGFHGIQPPALTRAHTRPANNEPTVTQFPFATTSIII
jgi:STE24 endopeptidase